MHLKIAVAEHPHTSAVRNGSIPIEGVDAEIITVQPQIAAFRRMVRQVEFDVCELAPTTYIIARAYGAPFVALPIFVQRRFHHAGLLVRPDAGIKTPKDLEGGRWASAAITGLGALIVKYDNRYDTASMFVPILVLKLLGILLTSLVRRAEEHFAPWRMTDDWERVREM